MGTWSENDGEQQESWGDEAVAAVETILLSENFYVLELTTGPELDHLTQFVTSLHSFAFLHLQHATRPHESAYCLPHSL